MKGKYQKHSPTALAAVAQDTRLGRQSKHDPTMFYLGKKQTKSGLVELYNYAMPDGSNHLGKIAIAYMKLNSSPNGQGWYWWAYGPAMDRPLSNIEDGVMPEMTKRQAVDQAQDVLGMFGDAAGRSGLKSLSPKGAIKTADQYKQWLPHKDGGYMIDHAAKRVRKR